MTQPAKQQAITIGSIRITFLPDGDGRIDKLALLPGTTPDGWTLHPEWLDENGRVLTTIGGFLIQTGGRNLLIDTGYGPQQAEAPGLGPIVGGRLLQSLATTGLEPRDIDTVLYSHLHLDHIGWTSRVVNGERELTFSRANHLLMATEWDFWRAPEPGSFQEAIGPGLAEVRQPLENHTEFVNDGQVIAPGVTVLATPGHTPGHLSLVVSSGAERAIILGDIMHCPVQFDEADWGVVFDVDKELARRTRERLMKELEDPATISADGHFPDVVFGRVMPAQGKRYWRGLP
jgi:glyoxylase-like metal-dependent hydrolase (beta-lactamase superfamily II)